MSTPRRLRFTRPVRLSILVTFAFTFAVAGGAAARGESEIGWADRRPEALGHAIDYIFPGAAESRPEPTVVRGLEAAPGADDVVAYRSFDGKDYTLNRIRGKVVDVLAPDAWFGDNLLTPTLARRLADKLDALYFQYREVLNLEPPGPEKTPVAFVTNCGFGCGYIGYKGVEIAPDDGAKQAIIPLLRNDFLNFVFLHEFAHNFDLYNGYLYNQDGDFAHAWTEWFDSFAGEFYSQAGNDAQTAAEGRLRERTVLYELYITDPARTWQSCFKDHDATACAYPNGAWGATLTRFAELHGDAAVLRYLAYLRGQRLGNVPIGTTNEARTDFHLRAMAEAAQQNTACYADAWRWYISPALRSELAGKFGATAAACLDADGDTKRPVVDDCDDTSASISPGVKEVAGNRIDDDCDGRVDERDYTEAADWRKPFSISLPAQIKGKIASGGDSDPFELKLNSPTWIYARLCSLPKFDGWLAIYGNANPDYLFTWGRNCSGYHYLLPAGTRGFSVFRYQNTGNYLAEIIPSTAWPPPSWTTPKPGVVQGARVVLRAKTAPGATFVAPPTHVRFWVSGLGVVAEIPYQATTNLRWTPPSTVPAWATYRTQALAQGVPVSPYSAPAVVAP